MECDAAPRFLVELSGFRNSLQNLPSHLFDEEKHHRVAVPSDLEFKECFLRCDSHAVGARDDRRARGAGFPDGVQNNLRGGRRPKP